MITIIVIILIMIILDNNDNDVLEPTVYPFLNSVLFSCPQTGGL